MELRTSANIGRETLNIWRRLWDIVEIRELENFIDIWERTWSYWRRTWYFIYIEKELRDIVNIEGVSWILWTLKEKLEYIWTFEEELGNIVAKFNTLSLSLKTLYKKVDFTWRKTNTLSPHIYHSIIYFIVFKYHNLLLYYIKK